MKCRAAPLYLHLHLVLLEVPYLGFQIGTFSCVNWQCLSSHLGRHAVSSIAEDNGIFHPLLIGVILLNRLNMILLYSCQNCSRPLVKKNKLFSLKCCFYCLPNLTNISFSFSAAFRGPNYLWCICQLDSLYRQCSQPLCCYCGQL